MIAAGEQSNPLTYANKVVQQDSVTSLYAASGGYEFKAVFQFWTCHLIGKINRLSPCLSMIGTLLHKKAKLIAADIAQHEIVETVEMAGN